MNEVRGDLKSEGYIVPLEIAMAAMPLFSTIAIIGLYPHDAPQIL